MKLWNLKKNLFKRYIILWPEGIPLNNFGLENRNCGESADSLTVFYLKWNINQAIFNN